MHCRAPIPQRVSVDVGCGIFVDMSVEEAHAYCANRLTSLSQLIGVLESELLKTGTDLAIAESGLRELHRAAQAEASEGAGTVQ